MESKINGKKIHIDSRIAAKLIKNLPGYHGQSIRLLSCSTGYLNHGFAQNLANKLNVTVWATNDILWAWPNGRHVVAARSSNPKYPDLSKKGKFVKFTPGGNRK